MSAPTTLRLVTSAPPRKQRRAADDREQIIDITVEADERLLLSIPEAAHRIGVSRSQLYNLIAAGEIPTVHIGRSCKISPAALVAFVEAHSADEARSSS